MNTPVVLYHGGCRDGFCAAWVAWQAFNGDIEAIPVFHGAPPPDVAGREVYILDFAYTKAETKAMADIASKLTIIDHHVTTKEEFVDADMPGFWAPPLSFSSPHGEELQRKVNIMFDLDRSGAGLAWDHFFPDRHRPWIVDYIEDRDLWRKKLSYSDEVNAYISTLPFDFDIWDREAPWDPNASHNPNRNPPEHVIRCGHTVLAKTRQYVAEVAKNAVRFRFEGYDVPLVNAPQTDVSELLAKLAENEPFAMSWWQRGDGMFIYSLRASANSDVNVAELAKRYGGGGHVKAAGFQREWPVHLPAPFRSPGRAGRLPDDD